MQGWSSQEHLADIDKILQKSDAEVMKFFHASMPASQLKSVLKSKGAQAVRAYLAKSQQNTHFAGPQGSDVKAAYELCGDSAGPKVVTLWRQRRQLPLPKAVAKGAKPAAKDPYDLPRHVNPTAWPAEQPYHEQEQGGGLMMPFECLNGFYELPCMESLRHVRGTGALHPALSVWAALAAALKRLQAVKGLSVTLDLGDICTLPQRLLSMPGPAAHRMFDRIHLNNVPDYTGMLPILTEVAPLLKTWAISWLTHGVLYGAPNHKTAAHFTHAHALVFPGPRLEALLGVASPRGTIWDFDICWQLCGGAAAAKAPLDGRITPARLCAWLRALLAQIVLPPRRDGHGGMLHHHPYTVHVWWRLVCALAHRVPAHWLASVVHAALQASGSANLSVPRVMYGPRGQPQAELGQWPAGEGQADQAIDMGIAAADLRVAALLATPRLPRPLLAQALQSAASESLMLLELPVGTVASLARAHSMQDRSQGGKLGLVLMHPSEAKRRQQQGSASGMSSIVAGPWLGTFTSFADVPAQHGTPSKRGTCLQLLSSVSWVRQAQNEGTAGRSYHDDAVAVRFWLCQAQLEAFQKDDWLAMPLTTDTWQGYVPEAVSMKHVSTLKVVQALQLLDK